MTSRGGLAGSAQTDFMKPPPSLTIVMYHYVRELRRSRFPEIKGLDRALFVEQLGYLRRHHEIVRMEALIAALRHHREGGGWELPANAALLTFDDGYADHFQQVFPLLDELGVQGSFFPPAQVVIERRLLDVNRIHFVLAAVADKRGLADVILKGVAEAREEFGLESPEAFYGRLAVASRMDPPEVIFIKRALQTGLPPSLRARIAADLFRSHVSADEAAFADELYMSLDQVRCLVRHGMFVGSHSDSHPWLGSLEPAEQEAEVEAALRFLRLAGAPCEDWVMCYPYGDSNESLRDILRARGCAIGLTTHVDLAHAGDDPLLLPRLDTNDLPKSATAPPVGWTRKALRGVEV